MKNTNTQDINKRKIAVFDFGEVLFHTSAEKMYRKMFQDDGRSEEDLQYFLTNIFTKHDRAEGNFLANITAITEPLAENNPEWAKYILAFNPDRDFMKQISGTVEDMPQVLKDLKENGYEIYGITNWAGDTFDKLSESYPSITGMFNNIVVSGKVGIKKPDPEIYKYAQQLFGNPDPSQVYFFDDKETNTLAANKYVGWNGVTFKNAATVRKALAL